jgi:glycosyltransferase involved in cell wall biosynthesis
MLSRIAYHQATSLVTLSDANRRKQLADGADPRKIVVVPNGVKWTEPVTTDIKPAVKSATPGRLRVGFVGRVVPIKDVITLIRAVSIAREKVDLEVSIIGPEDEDPIYARRCHQLVASLDLGEHVKFLGPKPMAEIYPTLDVVLLTSLSEGQPLVMLEAYAAGVPVIATDVGACREMVEGGDEVDKKLGPSGIVTRVANPTETAAALCVMARNPELRASMGKNGFARMNARYQLQHVVARYETIYASMVH